MRLHDYLEFRARVQPEMDFAIFAGKTLSFSEADAEANRIAHALRAAGLVAGDRFAILSKNCTELALLYYGASKAGVVPVPLNYRLAAPEWSYIIGDSCAKLLIARGELVSGVDPVRGELPQVERWVALGASLPGWQGWDEFRATAPAERVDCGVTSEDDLYQMYTSGTTGRPKGAVLSHGAVCANVEQVSLVYYARSGERALIVAPLYHAAAAVTTFVTVAGGGTLYIQEDFEPGETVRALSEERIGIATLVPAMIQFCLSAVPDVAQRSYASLRSILYGAAAISETVLRQAIETFGCDFVQGYGMTELTACATLLLPQDHVRALAGEPGLLLSAGRPVLGTELRIVDADGTDLPRGAVGEMVVRGPQRMKGYWHLPDATQDAIRDGWMYTGDAGRVDEEGFLFIQDRVKDMIVSGAENVYPREVEEVLFKHPAVADCAVIGVPSEQWGEAIKAVVVLREGMSAGEDEIFDFCRDKLAGYKRPSSIDFIEELPRNPSGKVLKRELREPYWKGKERRVN
jgi:acyl-CoA synthetase (AMP-forming)/AMP-acid ligase II